MSDFKILKTVEDFDAVVSQSETKPVVVFKHSSACSLSARAFSNLASLDQSTDPPVFQITVQESRALSNHIEATLGIRHESPQVIIFRDGKPVFNTSHTRVTAENVRENLN